MAKPTLKPDWATDGGSFIVEPPSGLKATGWSGGDRPPAEYQNWLHYISNEWVNFFDKKLDSMLPITLTSSATLLWSGSTIVFSQPIQIEYRYETGVRINQISNSASPLSFSDGDCLVFKRDNSSSSPVTLTTGSYGSLTAGHYVIVAGSSLTSTTQEDETILFRRNGSNLEIPTLGRVIATGSTFSLGLGKTWTFSDAVYIGNDGTLSFGSSATNQLVVGSSAASTSFSGAAFLGYKSGSNGAIVEMDYVNVAIGASDKRLAALSIVRNGADNTGSYQISVMNAGTLTNIANFEPGGLSMQANQDVLVTSGRYFRFDGSISGDTHMRENGANQVDLTCGGTTVASFNQGSGIIALAQEITLPSVTSPSAINRMSRRSTLKTWVRYSDGSPGGIDSSFNVSSVTDDDGDGIFDVNIDVDHTSSALTVPVATVATPGGGQDCFAACLASGGDQVSVFIHDVSIAGAADKSFFMQIAGE